MAGILGKMPKAAGATVQAMGEDGKPTGPKMRAKGDMTKMSRKRGMKSNTSLNDSHEAVGGK